MDKQLLWKVLETLVAGVVYFILKWRYSGKEAVKYNKEMKEKLKLQVREMEKEKGIIKIFIIVGSYLSYFIGGWSCTRQVNNSE